jgi:hypothetical protein
VQCQTVPPRMVLFMKNKNLGHYGNDVIFFDETLPV